MFHLRDGHFVAFEISAERALVARIRAHLRAEHGDVVQDVTDDELHRRIALGVGKARAYGFADEASLTAFVAIMLDVSPNFDEQPDIRAVLRDSTVDPSHRLSRLESSTSLEEWEAAALLPADKGWSQREVDSP